MQPTEILVLLSPAENTDRPKWAPSDFSGPTRGEAPQNSSLFASSGSISATCYCCCTAGAGYYGMVGNSRPTGERRASRRAAQHCATNFCLQKFRPRDGHLAQLDARASHSGTASIRNSSPRPESLLGWLPISLGASAESGGGARCCEQLPKKHAAPGEQCALAVA